MIRDLAVDLYATVDRAGMHHDRVRLEPVESLGRQAEERPVFADAREGREPLPLVLDAEQIHHIRVGQRLVHIVRHAASHFFVDARDERRRAAERDVRAELGQRPDVRPRHATVKDVPEDSNIEPADIALPFHHRKGVEQCLRGVLVCTVASVDHAAIHHAG